MYTADTYVRTYSFLLTVTSLQYHFTFFLSDGNTGMDGWMDGWNTYSAWATPALQQLSHAVSLNHTNFNGYYLSWYILEVPSLLFITANSVSSHIHVHVRTYGTYTILTCTGLLSQLFSAKSTPLPCMILHLSALNNTDTCTIIAVEELGWDGMASLVTGCGEDKTN